MWECHLSLPTCSEISYTQGRRQDFVKGGADARHGMPTPLWSGVWGPSGVWGSLTRGLLKTCSWNDWFNFLFVLILFFSFFFLSLFLSPPSLFSSLSFFWGGGNCSPFGPPCLRPCSSLNFTLRKTKWLYCSLSSVKLIPLHRMYSHYLNVPNPKPVLLSTAKTTSCTGLKIYTSTVFNPEEWPESIFTALPLYCNFLDQGTNTLLPFAAKTILPGQVWKFAHEYSFNTW